MYLYMMHYILYSFIKSFKITKVLINYIMAMWIVHWGLV